MTTHLLSIDHQLSGLDIVVWLGAVTPGLGPGLLKAVPVLRGVPVLSTCNRLALLVDADSQVDTDCPAALHPDLYPADASQPVAASDLGETIIAFLAERAGFPASDLLLAHLVGATARRGVLAITADLSSVVVGEIQIVGQVHRATEAAATGGTLSPGLVRAVGRASATTRRMAHEIKLSGQGRSVVVVGVGQAAGHLPSLKGCRALTVGTGSYAGVTIVDLRTRGLTDITVYSASNRAEAFVTDCGLCVVPAGALSEAMSRADLVVTCRDTGGPILTADIVAPVATERAGSAEGAGRPLVVLNLALACNVDEAIGALPGVVHFNLAHVRDAVPGAEARQVATARAIAEAEAADFERTLTGRAMDPLITTLRVQVGRVVAEKAARLRPQPAHRLALAIPAVGGRVGTGVSGVNSADVAIGACPHHHLAAGPSFETVSKIDGEPMVSLAQAERVLHHLVARLLHQPTVMARRTGQEGCEGAYRQALKLVWDLESTGGNHD